MRIVLNALLVLGTAAAVHASPMSSMFHMDPPKKGHDSHAPYSYTDDFNDKGFFSGDDKTLDQDVWKHKGDSRDQTPAAVPEPGTLAMAGLGLVAIVFATRRKRSGPKT